MKSWLFSFGAKSEVEDFKSKWIYAKGKDYQLKLKTKTADGVSFSGSVVEGAEKKKKSELELEFKDATMEVKNKLDAKGVFTVETTMKKVVPDVDACVKFVTPPAEGDPPHQGLFKSVTPMVTYQTAEQHISAEFECAFNGDSALAPTMACPKIGVEAISKVMPDLTAGLRIKDLEFGGAKSSVAAKELELAALHKCSGMSIQGSFLASLKEGKFDGEALTASVHQKVGTTTMAAEYKLAKDAEKFASSIKLLTSYAICPSTDLRSRVAFKQDSQPVVDFAWVQKFDGKTLSLMHEYGTKSAFAVQAEINV